jgi:hypothetical protein
MTKNRSECPKDGTESERRKFIGNEEMKELELAGTGRGRDQPKERSSR